MNQNEHVQCQQYCLITCTKSDITMFVQKPIVAEVLYYFAPYKVLVIKSNITYIAPQWGSRNKTAVGYRDFNTDVL